ncbi:MAG: hypothetical protein PVF83_15535 [Anaerolineales bacterium]|jgi:hypothetical protein
MNQKIVEQISKTVYKQFPEVQGSKPRVMAQPQPKSLKTEESYVLTYRAITEVQGGKRFPRQVRVVVNPNGKILRVSTSR